MCIPHLYAKTIPSYLTNSVKEKCLHNYFREGQKAMITTNTWWESIFSGPLAHGINEEKLHLLENENFLYLNDEEANKEEQEIPTTFE